MIDSSSIRQAAEIKRRPTPVAGDNRAKFVVAALASLLFHGGLAWSVYDKSLSDVASQSIDSAQILRVRRVRSVPAVEAVVPLGSDIPRKANSQRVSQTMLANLENPIPWEPSAPEAVVESADYPTFTDKPVVRQEPGSIVEVVDHLVGSLELDVPLVPSKERELEPPSLSADAKGEIDDPASLSQALLATAGLLPAPASQTRRPIVPELVESVPTDLHDNTPTPPQLDFTRHVLRQAMQLSVPQYLDSDFEYKLFAYRPSGRFGAASEEGGYFRVDITGRQSLRKLKAMPKDVIFLIDTSGSVSQPWVDAVNRGVADALSSLNRSDRFNIVLFKDKPSIFAPSIQTVSEQTLSRAVKFLHDVTSGGYTDVNRALSRLLVRDVAVDRVYDLILISDGRPTRGIQDTRELINLITRDNDMSSSIYCVGIGRSQNHRLLEFLTYRNKGFCVYAGRADQTAGVIRDLASRLRYPLIKNVTLQAGGLDIDHVFPRHIPNIHQGETFSIFGRFDQIHLFKMHIGGSNFDRTVTFAFSHNLKRAAPGDHVIARDWAFHKLHHLYSEQIRRGNDKQIDRQIRRLEKRYKMKSLR